MWQRRGLGSKPTKLGSTSASPMRAARADQQPRRRGGAVIVSRSEDYMAARRSDGLFSIRRSVDSRRSDRRSAEMACSAHRPSSDSQPPRLECRRSDNPQLFRRSDGLGGPSKVLERLLLASRRSDPVHDRTPIIVSKPDPRDARKRSATPALGGLTGPTTSAASSGIGPAGTSKASLAGAFASRSSAVARLGSIRVRNLARRRPAPTCAPNCAPSCAAPDATDLPRASAEHQSLTTPLYV
eukprot:6174863-Pleurochrysis_carterae.AAC.2